MTASWLKRLLFLSAATGGGAWETVTGAIASFFATKAKPVKLSFLLKPIQAGSGDPSPENVRAISGHEGSTVMQCKENLLAGKFASGKSGAITYTVNDDGSILTTGTSTSTAVLRSDGINVTEGETYKLYGCPNGGGIDTYRLDVRDSEGNLISTLPYDIGSGATITIPSGTTTIKIGIRIAAGNDVSGLIFKPILAKSADVYTPKLATFPSVVYSGEVDWNAGKLKNVFAYVSKKYSELTNSSGTTPEGYSLKSIDISSAVGDYANATSAICNLAKYNASSNAQNVFRITSTGKYIMLTLPTDTDADTEIVVCYPLATPTEVSLSDLDSIVPVVGINNVWVDNSDNISVEYFGVNT